MQYSNIQIQFKSRQQVGYGPEYQCCKGVVDPITLISILAGIVGITLVLRAAVKKYITGRKKRSLLDGDNLAIVIIQGNGDTLSQSQVQCYQC